MIHIFIMTVLVKTIAVAKYIYDTYKFHGDYHAFDSKSKDAEYNKKFAKALAKIFALSLGISIVLSGGGLLFNNIYMDKESPSNQNKSIKTTKDNDISDEPTTFDVKITTHQCKINPYENDFYDKIANCIFYYKCEASAHLCNEIANSNYKSNREIITCTLKIGKLLPLERRRDLSNRLREERCFAASYSWLAGVPGAEAENARGAWRAMVCPDNPAVFSDPSFALLGPPPDGGCRR